MKIVHIITRLIVGGAQENTLLSCEGQHDAGHEVILLSGPAIGPEGSLVERAAGYGYRLEIIEPMRRAILPLADWRSRRWLVRRLRELKPDVVHTHSSKAGIIGRWAAHAAGVPAVIHTIHGLAFTASTRAWMNGFYKFLERRAAPITDRIVCVADAMRRQSLDAGIGRPDQYVTVYSGMQTEAFIRASSGRDAARAQLGIGKQDVVAGTIARLFDLKGHEDLIALAPELCNRYPHLRFLWIGDGSLREGYERQIAALGLKDRFILTGLVPPARIPEMAAAMDILVHPSRREGLARALPQGQLAGCPAIAYDIDGNREGLIEGQTGFAVPPFDVRMLCQKLSLLLEDEPLRHRMGEAGRQFALRRFDTRVMVDALQGVYQRCLQEKGRA